MRRWWRTGALVAGLVATAVALGPPVERWSHELLAAHMVQHVLLVAVAPPLLALGAPLPPLRTGPGRHQLRAVLRHGGGGTAVAVAGAVHVAVLAAWHLPSLYDAAVEHLAVHLLEHALLVGTSYAFWATLLRPGRSARRRYGVGILAVGGTMAFGGALGALLTFAPQPLYASYTGSAAAGLTALEDQQLAGLIMWVPGGVIYAVVGVILLLRWLDAVDAGNPLPTAHAARRWPSGVGSG